MAKSINMSGDKKPVAFGTPPGIKLPGITGDMPIPAGKVVRSFKPTDAEREVLEAVGWEDGDPIPPNFAEIIKESLASATTGLQPPVPVNTPRMKIPKEINIRDLPEQKRNELLAALDDAKIVADMMENMESTELDPSVQQAIRVAKGDPGIEVVDDRKDTKYAGTNVSKKAAAEEDDPYGGKLKLERCPNCDCNLLQPQEPPSEEDKFVFLQLTLGGKPFQKQYEFYDGQLMVVIRGLTVREGDLLIRQCNIQKERGELKTPADFYEELTRYSMALQVIYVKTGSDTFDLPDSLKGWEESVQKAGLEPKNGSTVLESIKEYFFDNVVKTESMGRILSMGLTEFNTLNRQMEVNYTNRNFLKGTLGSR